MIQIESGELSAIKALRDNYFEDIVLPQELYLEWLVAEGSYFRIYKEKEVIGYFIKSKDNELIEFYLISSMLYDKEDIFKQIIDRYAIKQAYCKSFDAVLLTCCHTFCKSSKLFGTIFRDYTNEVFMKVDQGIRIRPALESDIAQLLTYKGGELYETQEELNYMVSEQIISLFEKGGRLIGCSYLTQILPNRNYYDIGMWVNPDFRGKGYASMIVAHLKKYCFEHNYIPVCGCAADNIASRKTLEKNGFISKYSLIEFEF